MYLYHTKENVMLCQGLALVPCVWLEMVRDSFSPVEDGLPDSQGLLASAVALQTIMPTKYMSTCVDERSDLRTVGWRQKHLPYIQCRTHCLSPNRQLLQTHQQ